MFDDGTMTRDVQIDTMVTIANDKNRSSRGIVSRQSLFVIRNKHQNTTSSSQNKSPTTKIYTSPKRQPHTLISHLPPPISNPQNKTKQSNHPKRIAIIHISYSCSSSSKAAGLFQKAYKLPVSNRPHLRTSKSSKM